MNDTSMKDECLICGAPLKYLETEQQMECAICHKKENSNTVCRNGHYVCNECHTGGMDSIIGLCLSEKSKNPIEIIWLCRFVGAKKPLCTAPSITLWLARRF